MSILEDTYLKTLRRYLDRPRAALGGDLDAELTVLENRMLDEPPPGKVKGLVAATREPLPSVVSPEAVGLAVIPEREWLERVAEADAASAWPARHVWTTLDQGGVGSCASEGISGAMMNLREVENQQRTLFNPLGMYGRVNGGRDAGSSLQDNVSFAQRYGCFPESVWPRSNGWRAKPSDEAYDAAKAYRLREIVQVRNNAEFGSALLVGCPVYFGYSGHAIFATRLIDRNRFWYQNSWGQWGDNGGASLSFGSIMWSYGAYAILAPTWAGPDIR